MIFELFSHIGRFSTSAGDQKGHSIIGRLPIKSGELECMLDAHPRKSRQSLFSTQKKGKQKDDELYDGSLKMTNIKKI